MKKILGLLILSFVLFASCDKQNPPEARFWAWSHAHTNYSEAKWDSLFAKMHDHGFKGLLIGADSAALVRLIPIAHKHHIEVHAWMWAMNRGDAKPEWLSVNALGQSLADERAYVDYYKFMCPALPEVRQFIKSKVEQLASIKGLAGVHLDYIRYVDVYLPVALQPKYNLQQDSIMPQFDYGYHPYLRNKYQEQFGVDPFDLADMAHDSSWFQFRLDQVNEAVNLLPELSDKHGVQLTAAVFPEPEMSAHMVRQQWNNWNIDAFYPMVYYNFYNENPQWVGTIVAKAKSMVPDKNIICGLYLPGIADKESFRESIVQAFTNGASGVSFFELSSLKEEHWQVLKELK